MLRRTAVLAAGLALTASIGLVGAGAASAASPALKIKNGAQWTNEVNGGLCEVQTFSSNGTWTSDLYGDSGTWSGGGDRIDIKWTGGDEAGLTFHGPFTTTPTKEYSGKFGGFGVGATGQEVKGVVSSWNGVNC